MPELFYTPLSDTPRGILGQFEVGLLTRDEAVYLLQDIGQHRQAATLEAMRFHGLTGPVVSCFECGQWFGELTSRQPEDGPPFCEPCTVRLNRHQLGHDISALVDAGEFSGSCPECRS